MPTPSRDIAIIMKTHMFPFGKHSLLKTGQGLLESTWGMVFVFAPRRCVLRQDFQCVTVCGPIGFTNLHDHTHASDGAGLREVSCHLLFASAAPSPAQGVGNIPPHRSN